VFMNLLVNAIQAIADRGTIRIRIGVEGSQVRVDVEDTGSGVAPAHLARIFDPGFTTKGVGVGTGLGLAICHQIVTAHAGTISVASEPGAGSTFTVRLPLAGPALTS
jgi:two-component system, NtrC family, sensor kinase